MRRLIACTIGIGCALAGLGVAVTDLVPANTSAATVVISGPPAARATTASLGVLAPGPANPGGPYVLPASPCHPWACAGR
jgi:hypothetical protein